MKNIHVLTSNQGKFDEIKKFLESSNSIIVDQVTVDLDEIQELDVLKIIHHKVNEALKLGFTNFLLEDTSLYIDGLNRLPGPFIKWFLQDLSTDGIYKMAMALGNGAAQAETIVAYVDNNNKTHIFRGATGGKIVEPRGDLGFGWAKIFKPDNCNKTYAEMAFEEKSLWNQRIKALQTFKDYLLS